MEKVVNKILMVAIFLVYFIMICVNVRNFATINTDIIIGISLIAIALVIFKSKELVSSKVLFLASIFFGVYYISLMILKNNSTEEYYNGSFTGMFSLIVFSVGIIFTRIIIKNKENINRLIFVVSIALTLVGLISIDMASIKVFSTYLGILIKAVTNVNFLTVQVWEPGVRMKSIITNPNIFASLTVVPIFLNLYLNEIKYKKEIVVWLLFINMVAFIYSFSLGATIAFCICLVFYIIINRKNDLIRKLYKVGVTIVLAFICVLIGAKGMGQDGLISYLPMGVLFIFAIICEDFINKKSEVFINKIWPWIKKYKVIFTVMFIPLVSLSTILVKPINFSAENAEKNVSIGLKQGNYKVKLFFDKEISGNIIIFGQTYEQASKRKYDTLYENDIKGNEIVVEFNTFEKNKAINFRITIPEEGNLTNIKLYDSNDKFIKNIKTDYLLLPDFIETRLSPFNANQNGIQRFTFFSDGLKIWLKSPIIGNGPSAYYNNYLDVNTSETFTWSSHNFMIDILCDVGIIGALSIIAFIIYILYLIVKNLDNDLIKTFGIIFIFMLGHSLIEMNFIYIPYMFTLGIVCGFISKQAEEKFENSIMVKVNTGLLYLINVVNIVLLVMYKA